MSWLKKLFGLKERKNIDELPIKFAEDICEALRNLGEAATYHREYSRWIAETAPGIKQICIEIDCGIVNVSIPAITSRYVSGPHAYFLDIKHDYMNFWLNGRKSLKVFFPVQFAKLNAGKIAREFLDLANEFSLMVESIRELQSLAIPKETEIARIAQQAKEELDKKIQQQIQQLRAETLQKIKDTRPKFSKQ